MMRRVGFRILAPLAATGLSLALGACAPPNPPQVPGTQKPAAAKPEWHDLSYTVPPKLAGYDLKDEADGAKALQDGGAESLITAGRLVSFRQGTRLFATMEVVEIKSGHDPADANFQRTVVAQVGTSVMRPEQVKGMTVYQGSGNRQLVYVWFKDRLMHILLTHDVKDPGPLVDAVLDLA